MRPHVLSLASEGVDLTLSTMAHRLCHQYTIEDYGDMHVSLEV
jgi:hypothetical protein